MCPEIYIITEDSPSQRCGHLKRSAKVCAILTKCNGASICVQQAADDVIEACTLIHASSMVKLAHACVDSIAWHVHLAKLLIRQLHILRWQIGNIKERTKLLAIVLEGLPKGLLASAAKAKTLAVSA